MTRQEREIRDKLLSTGYLIWMEDRWCWRDKVSESLDMAITAKVLQNKWMKQGLVEPCHGCWLEVQITRLGSEILG